VTFVLDEDRAAARAAALLARLRLPPGEIVAVLAGNNETAIAARDAATAGELVLAPINPRLAPPEIGWLLGHARPRALIVDREHAALAPDGITTILVDDDRPLILSESPQGRVEGRDLYASRGGATLLYTSGTTGTPKGCLRSDAQDRARIDELTATYALTADDVHLVACPLAHSAPGIFLRACRAAGARTVVAPAFRAEAFLAAVAAHRASVFFLVPTQWQRLLALPDEVRRRADWSSLRCAIVAGAPIAAETKARIADWIGPDRLWEFYGSSETGTVTVIGPRDHAAHPGSVGRPPAGVSIELRDGEVFVSSPAVMSGYLDATGALVPATPPISVGDLGTLDAAGWLTLIDRKHDTIISGGMNVYPAEVERALAEHPAVAGAVVFGVDDPEWGQRVAAVIAARGAPPSPAALLAFLRDRIAAYKLPRALAFCALDDLPIGSSGKALRRAARVRFAALLQSPTV
jgi:acyl-CoA synthetase (AMP-forming)/AMP-acid ligase II